MFGICGNRRTGIAQIALAAIIGAVFLGAGLFLGRLFWGGSSSGSSEASQHNLFQRTLGAITDTVGDVFSGSSAPEAVEITLNTLESSSAAFGSAENASTTLIIEETATVAAVAGSSGAADGGSAIPAAPAPPAQICDFDRGGGLTHALVINEVAWMGSPVFSGVSASGASANEWMELKNVSGSSVALTGYQVLDREGRIKVVFDSGIVPSGGFLLLERTDDESVPQVTAEKIYSGSLPNEGAHLKLFNKNCLLVDEVNALAGYPAGENDTKKTMERNRYDFLWHTSAAAGGTPGAENSSPAPATLVSVPSVLGTSPVLATTTETRYRISISKIGSGSGKVMSTPAGISCGEDCNEDVAPGTYVAFAPLTDAGSYFFGWSFPCNGTGACGLLVTQDLNLSAEFRAGEPGSGGAPPPPPPPSGGGTGLLLISEIKAGSDGNVDDEFIEFYNAGSAPVDLTGYSVRKKSSTGSESSLIAASRLEGKIVQPGKYLLTAHDGGYAGSVSPDVLWPTSYGIAYTNNAVALYDSAGTKREEVSWAEIPAGQSYARDSWSGSSFTLTASPSPQGSQ